MTPSALCSELDAATKTVITEPDVDLTGMQALAASAVEVATGATDADRRAILGAVQRMQQAIKTRMKATQGRLRDMGRGRRAIRGYASLRSHSTGQRLFRKA